jgi:hypothetical protein
LWSPGLSGGDISFRGTGAPLPNGQQRARGRRCRPTVEATLLTITTSDASYTGLCKGTMRTKSLNCIRIIYHKLQLIATKPRERGAMP